MVGHLKVNLGWFKSRVIDLCEWDELDSFYGSCCASAVPVIFEHKTTGEILKGSVPADELWMLEKYKGGEFD